MLYILKLSIALSVIYLFYWLVLRTLTFYNWNRWYLLGYTALCFVIPFVDVFGWLQEKGLEHTAVVTYIPALTQVSPVQIVQQGSHHMNGEWIATMLIGAGSVFLLLRLVMQFLSLHKMRAGAVLLSDSGVKLYHVDRKIMPFSTARAIYINRDLHREDELKDIIRHEFIHVKQRHAFDLLFGEVLCMLNWYNPFVWLIRKAIRQNLEFIADQQVLESGIDRKQYQYLLLKVTGISSYSIAANFNFTSLKKRIAMMNKNKSARLNVIRFLFILPLLVVVLLAFRTVADHKAYNDTKDNPLVTILNNAADTTPAPPVAKIPPPVVVKLPSWMGAIKRKGDKVTIKLQNGKVEHYDLSKADEEKAFLDKFGDIFGDGPIKQFPPDAPAPPAPPVQHSSASVPAVPAPPAIKAPASVPDAAAIPAPPVQRASVSAPAAPAPPVKRASGAIPAPPKRTNIPAPPAAPTGGTTTSPAMPPPPAGEEITPVAAPAPPPPAGATSSARPARASHTESIEVMPNTAAGSAKETTVERLSRTGKIVANGSASGLMNQEEMHIEADLIIVEPAHGSNKGVQSSKINPVERTEEVASITKGMSLEELEKLLIYMQDKGYTMKVIESQFDKNGLSSLRMEVAKGTQKTSLAIDTFSKVAINSVVYRSQQESFNVNIHKGSLHL